MTDPRGVVVATNTYDCAGRVTTQTDALDRSHCDETAFRDCPL